MPVYAVVCDVGGCCVRDDIVLHFVACAYVYIGVRYVLTFYIARWRGALRVAVVCCMLLCHTARCYVSLRVVVVCCVVVVVWYAVLGLVVFCCVLL